MLAMPSETHLATPAALLPLVTAVAASAKHGVRKITQPAITLLPGLGVEGDAHCGALVRHRYLAARDPSQPNLRQVHLIQSELLDELRAAGLHAASGSLGENITTRNIDLLALHPGAQLCLGPDAIIEITGLRDPCRLLDRQQPGLMAAVRAKLTAKTFMFRAALMAIVVTGGEVRPGYTIAAIHTTGAHRPLTLV